MKVYRIMGAEGDYQFLVPVGRGRRNVSGDGNRQRDQGIAAELVTTNNGIRLKPTDFPWLSAHIPVFSARAVAGLREVLEAHGSLKRVDGVVVEGGDLYGLEVTVKLDALDHARTKAIRFSSGRLMDIQEHVFLADAIGGWKMFHLTDFDRAGWTYVTDEYVREVERTGLPGAGFELLWADE